MSVVAWAAAQETGNGFDWTKLFAVPGAIASVVALVLYSVGLIRPVAVLAPSYWHDGTRTRMSIAVKNRSALYDRSIDGIIVVRVPGWLKRTFTRKWRKHSQPVDLVPWGVDLPRQSVPIELSKRKSRGLEFELTAADGTPKQVKLDTSYRIEATSAKRHSRSKKIRFTDL